MKYLFNFPKRITDTYESFYGNSEASIDYFNKKVLEFSQSEDYNENVFCAALIVSLIKRNQQEKYTIKDAVSFIKSFEEIDFKKLALSKGITSEELIDSLESFLGATYE